MQTQYTQISSQTRAENQIWLLHQDYSGVKRIDLETLEDYDKRGNFISEPKSGPWKFKEYMGRTRLDQVRTWGMVLFQ